eukprot:3341141-Amphidinium_carterae.1
MSLARTCLGPACAWMTNGCSTCMCQRTKVTVFVQKGIAVHGLRISRTMSLDLSVWMTCEVQQLTCRECVAMAPHDKLPDWKLPNKQATRFFLLLDVVCEAF